MNAPWNPPKGVRLGQWARSLADSEAAMTAAASYPTCPDCGSTAQGRGFFGKLYCGLCERSIPEVRS